MPPQPLANATSDNRRGTSARDADESTVALLLWLLAAAAVLPGAVDLPFLRGEVLAASQLDSLIGRTTLAALGLVASFTLLTRIAGSRPSPIFGLLACTWSVLLLVSLIEDTNYVDLARPSVLLLVAISLSLCRIALPHLLWHARAILRTCLALCVIALVVTPDYAWAAPLGTRNWLGVPQFLGIAPHANSLGPVAALALLLELTVAGRRHWRWTFGALALVVLTVTQSRAGWAAGVLVLFLSASVPQGRFGPRRALLFFEGVIGVVFVGFLLISFFDFQDFMNGRLGLWAQIIDNSGQSWLTGYGLSGFATAGVAEYGFASWAGQGHNQFLDAFFTGGILSLAFLVALIVVCAAWAVRSGPQRRIAVAAFAVLVIGTIVEAPLRPALGLPVLSSVIVLAIVSAHGFSGSGVKAPSQRTPLPGFARE